ncbi:MAG: hypothetical protein LH629_13420 [Ignavibacteria bacterium]|nr:hypothetical protein [Ignavibacteria bacterium]
MKSITFNKSGKSKEEIMQCLEKLEKKYSDEISENNISIKKNGTEFTLSAVKKILFLTYKIDAKLIISDGLIKLDYESNIPESFEKDAIKMIEDEINTECV